ncbi:hypothetical protein K1X22_06645 [Mycolicibacterium farcinogenes]|uniref:hypothetical protein n=1 Tax=Mycolicibacterium farcinogenes TaxID=1802 RepID=UPI001C8EF024|nr:hypothetical protein [Mycolicibacterium farcinogenes]QZH61416.1 hypothetical protein K1X22_06645 [Mycolicibacterium farcinogenes]
MTYPSPPQSDPELGQTPGGYNLSAAVPHTAANALRARRTRTMALVMGPILVAVLAVAAVVGWVGLERITGGHPVSAADQVSGDRDEWSAAVCADGSVSRISDGKIRFPNVENYASCMSRVPGSGGGVVPILIGEWEDESTMRRDLAISKMIRHSAWMELGDIVIAFASIGDTGTTTLEPLTQFGFSIVPLQ